MVPEPDNPQALNRFSYVYNAPLNYIDPSGYCRVEGRDFEYAEDCTADEFSKLSWANRLLWLRTFVAAHALDDWFADIEGAIGNLSGDTDFSKLDGWASLADGGILEAIQTGWHLFTGESTSYASAIGVEAARGWGEFFAQKDDPAISHNQLIETRLKAEQMGATYGYTLAYSRYEVSGRTTQWKIRVFAFGADSYRAIVPAIRNTGSVGEWADVLRVGVLDPRTSWGTLSQLGKLAQPLAYFYRISDLTRDDLRMNPYRLEK